MSKDTQFRESTELIKAFDPPDPRDPVDALAEFIEQKADQIQKYARRSNPNHDYIKRQIDEIKHLQSIYQQLSGLRLYPIWTRVEEVIQKNSDTADGLRLLIPFRIGAADDRFINIDLR